MIHLEVAYAKPWVQVVLEVESATPITVREAILRSGILERFAEIDLDRNAVGLFGTVVDLDHVPESGERIEIYRPLALDPKERRRQRARAVREGPG